MVPNVLCLLAVDLSLILRTEISFLDQFPASLSCCLSFYRAVLANDNCKIIAVKDCIRANPGSIARNDIVYLPRCICSELCAPDVAIYGFISWIRLIHRIKPIDIISNFQFRSERQGNQITENFAYTFSSRMSMGI